MTPVLPGPSERAGASRRATPKSTVSWLPGSTAAVEPPPARNRVDSQGNWSSSASCISDGGLVGKQSSAHPVIRDSVTLTATELHAGSGNVDSLNDARQAGDCIAVKPGSTHRDPARALGSERCANRAAFRWRLSDKPEVKG